MGRKGHEIILSLKDGKTGRVTGPFFFARPPDCVSLAATTSTGPRAPTAERRFPIRTLLVGIEIPGRPSADSLPELERLAQTLGIEEIRTTRFKLRRVHPLTLLGSGQLERLRAETEEYAPDAVIIDDELQPVHARHLGEVLPVETLLDRTQLIIEIFAAHARTREGQLQVELAHLQYLLPRQKGFGLILSRLGGGIGTRGPGESKRELKLREIREKIVRLRQEIRAIETRRQRKRQARKSVPLPLVCLVGYTNAGKSTLLNRLCKSDILTEDRLFSTLDPTTRRLTLPSLQRILLSDTVGFIQRLPPQLVHAFRSTLEEAVVADLLLVVADGRDPDWREKSAVVDGILAEIGCGTHPRLRIWNKADCPETPPPPAGWIGVSARSGLGLNDLFRALDEWLLPRLTEMELRIPRSADAVLRLLHQSACILRRSEEEHSVILRVRIDPHLIGRLLPYAADNN